MKRYFAPVDGARDHRPPLAATLVHGVSDDRFDLGHFVRAVKNVQSALEAGEDPKLQIELAGTFLAVS